MQRRSCGPGCIVAFLGLALGCCLLPYLVSSIYSIVTALLQVPATATWLWGDWLSTVVGSNQTLYMILAEGPICCVGTLSLLVLILGLFMFLAGPGQPQPTLDEAYQDIYPEPWDEQP
jgi:hypothetical protein